MYTSKKQYSVKWSLSASTLCLSRFQLSGRDNEAWYIRAVSRSNADCSLQITLLLKQLYKTLICIHDLVCESFVRERGTRWEKESLTKVKTIANNESKFQNYSYNSLFSINESLNSMYLFLKKIFCSVQCSILAWNYGLLTKNCYTHVFHFRKRFQLDEQFRTSIVVLGIRNWIFPSYPSLATVVS